MLGRTNVSLPVCHSRTAPPCREFEQCIELITQRSSARSARCGNSELIQSPLSPCWRNSNGEPTRLPMRLGNDTTRGRFSGGKRTAAVARQERLGIERIQVRRAAEHEQHDHPLHPRRESAAAAARAGSPPPATLRPAAPPGPAPPNPRPVCASHCRARQPGVRDVDSSQSSVIDRLPTDFDIRSIDVDKLVGRQEARQSPCQARRARRSAALAGRATPPTR